MPTLDGRTPVIDVRERAQSQSGPKKANDANAVILESKHKPRDEQLEQLVGLHVLLCNSQLVMGG